MRYADQKRFFVQNEVGIIVDNPPLVLVQNRESIGDKILYFVESRTKNGDLQFEFFTPKQLPTVKVVPVVTPQNPAKGDILLFRCGKLSIMRRLPDVVDEVREALGRKNMGRTYNRLEELCVHIAKCGLLSKEEEIIKKMNTIKNLKERFYGTKHQGERDNCESLFKGQIEKLLDKLIDN